MSAVLAALFPVFALIGLGYALKRFRLIADGFWVPAETLTFYLFFPALLVTSTAQARIAGGDVVLLWIALGFALNLSDLGLPPLLGPLPEALGRIALPLGLIAVGAGLDFAAARRAIAAVAVTGALKLVGVPLIVLGLCAAFRVGGLAATVAVLCAALPGSATSYVVSRQMGGDAPLMAGIIAVTTLGAVVSLPLWLAVMARF